MDRPEEIGEKAGILAEVCGALTNGRRAEAAAIVSERYPFAPVASAGRRYSPRQLTGLHRRDGFIDRYSGTRLVCPGALRLLSRLLPEQFPFHSNWKADVCHFAFYELFPTLDHVVPVSRGGPDAAENWVTTSMLRNSAKANFTLDELGWRIHPPGDMTQWDGLLGWFIGWIDSERGVLDDPYLRRWHQAARE
jgi:hypothetical protein